MRAYKAQRIRPGVVGTFIPDGSTGGVQLMLLYRAGSMLVFDAYSDVVTEE